VKNEVGKRDCEKNEDLGVAKKVAMVKLEFEQRFFTYCFILKMEVR